MIVKLLEVMCGPISLNKGESKSICFKSICTYV